MTITKHNVMKRMIIMLALLQGGWSQLAMANGAEVPLHTPSQQETGIRVSSDTSVLEPVPPTDSLLLTKLGTSIPDTIPSNPEPPKKKKGDTIAAVVIVVVVGVTAAVIVGLRALGRALNGTTFTLG